MSDDGIAVSGGYPNPLSSRHSPNATRMGVQPRSLPRG